MLEGPSLPSTSFKACPSRRPYQTQQSHLCQDAAAAPANVHQPRIQTPGQSVPAPNINSLPLDNMIRAVTVGLRNITEFYNAVSKEAKIQAITKVVLTLVEQNGQ
jgi:hypothetical protein